MWRFRFSLTSDRRALTKFLKCVDWSDASEARQAAELMQQWAPIEIADALELLSPDFSNQEVGCQSAAAPHAADSLTCVLPHLEESVPCGAAASIQLHLWGLAGMADCPGLFHGQCLAAYLNVCLLNYLFIYYFRLPKLPSACAEHDDPLQSCCEAGPSRQRNDLLALHF